MLSFFKSIRPLVVAIVVLYGLLVARVFNANNPLTKGAFGLGILFTDWHLDYSHITNFLLRGGILIASAMMLNKAAVKFGVYSRSNYFVALSFLLLAAYNFQGLAQWPVLFSVFFISAGYRYWLEFMSISSYNGPLLLNAIFFWVIAGLFYWPLFLLGILLPIPMIFASVSNWRAYLLPLLVHFFFFLALLPWILLGYIQSNWYEIPAFSLGSFHSFSELFNSYRTAIPAIVTFLLLIIAEVGLLANIRRKKVSNRRIFRVNNVWIILLMIVWIISPGSAGEVGVILAVPASFVLANWFYYLPNRIYWQLLFAVICLLPFFMTLII